MGDLRATSASVRRSNVAGFRLIVDGIDISDKARPRLVGLTLTDKRGGEADQLDLVLDDSDGRLALPRKGASVQLALGWLQGDDVRVGLVDKGRFTVDQVEWGGPPDTVTIRARSADLTAGFRTRRETSHRDTTLGTIARDIAKRQKLEPRIAAALESIPVPVLAQHQQSDMALLRQLGRRHDAVATVKDGKLILAPIGRAASAGGVALPALQLLPIHVSDYRYSEEERSADAGVEARWHDQDKGERHTVAVGGKGDAGGKPRRLRKVFHSEADAMAAASAAASRAKRAEASFDVTLKLGRPDLLPEQPVTPAGFKPTIDARRWLIAELSHSLDASGLTTKLKLETAA
ncbi:MAG: phage late control D family protein [Pseudomonadota bacterium]